MPSLASNRNVCQFIYNQHRMFTLVIPKRQREPQRKTATQVIYNSGFRSKTVRKDSYVIHYVTVPCTSHYPRNAKIVKIFHRVFAKLALVAMTAQMFVFTDAIPKINFFKLGII